MALKSAGIWPFRRRAGAVQVLLVHPGDPFWRKRDHGAWSIAKGEYGDDEQAETAGELGIAHAFDRLVIVAEPRMLGGSATHSPTRSKL